MSSPQGGAQEKTEQATPKRLSEARKKGQVVKSMDLVAALCFFGAVLVFALVSERTFGSGVIYLSRSLAQLGQAKSMDGYYNALFTTALNSYFAIVWPMLVAALVVGVLGNIVQVGFLLTFDPIKPELNRLNPVEGLKRMFSTKALFDFFKAFLKLALIGYAAYSGIRGELTALLLTGYADGLGALVTAGNILMRVAVRVGLVYVAIGVADFAYQRYEHNKNMMMSKQEVKEEHKQTEGDPQIRARQREIQRMFATRRMFADIPKATVIVTNPTHFAVALRYDEGETPIVCAKGCDYLAQRIIAKAKEHGVPVVEQPLVARSLYKQVEVGSEIPVELYRAVAEILATILAEKGRI